MIVFLRFLVVGGIAALVNIGARVLLSFFLPFSAAVAAAFPFGLLVAFGLSKAFVFTSSGSMQGELLRFTLVNLLALLQIWLISVLLVDWLFPTLHFRWHADLVGHTVGVISPVATSYLAHRRFTFRNVSPPPAAGQSE